MGGEHIICPRHNFEGIARYGECPHCSADSEKALEENPVIMPEERLKFSPKEAKKVKKMKEILEERKRRRGIGGLIRHLYPMTGKLEYDPDIGEIKDKQGNVWFVAFKGHWNRVNVAGYEIVEAYNHIDDVIPRVITYIPDPAIPLENDERKELQKLQETVKYLKLELDKSLKRGYDNAYRMIKLNANCQRKSLIPKTAFNKIPMI